MVRWFERLSSDSFGEVVDVGPHAKRQVAPAWVDGKDRPLKGHASLRDFAQAARFEGLSCDARLERAIVFHIEAWDSNCPQHITPRYTLQEIEGAQRRSRGAV